MRKITISLPESLYAELTEVARSTQEKGFTAEDWAGELLTSELASRRLPHVRPSPHKPHARGLHIRGVVEEHMGHRVVQPETVFA